jgi:hypothetical protein
MSLDCEPTLIHFNGKEYDFTKDKDILTKSSKYLKTLIDECDGDISINTTMIKEDIFERVIDIVRNKGTFSCNNIDEMMLAFNYPCHSLQSTVIDLRFKLFYHF